MKYPYITYIGICNKGMDGCKLRPVVITSYTDSVSVGAFYRRFVNVADSLHATLRYYNVFNYTPVIKHAFELEQELVMCKKFGYSVYSVDGYPVTLQEYYKEIGYDPKKKKIGGNTILQYFKEQVKNDDKTS